MVTRPAASEDDDIQEVLPVKAEPLPSQLQQLDQFGGDTGQYEEEGFEHLDQYDDSAIVEGATGHDASKGRSFHLLYTVPTESHPSCLLSLLPPSLLVDFEIPWPALKTRYKKTSHLESCLVELCAFVLYNELFEIRT